MANQLTGSPWFWQYPKGDYATEQPLWITFSVSKYSLINYLRTNEGILTNCFGQIKLPMPREIGYSANHEFGMGFSPLLPSTDLAPNLANNGGQYAGQNPGLDPNAKRELALSRANFFAEYANATGTTSTLRRFSNITELTLVSEARKKYVFEYIFAPKNKDESIEVEEIVGSFRKSSYPTAITDLPERTYPQNLWALTVSYGSSAPEASQSENPTGDWLGNPLPCVLKTVSVKKNDRADPIIRMLPSGYSNITMMGLVFEEFETGTFDPESQEVVEKSKISYDYYGYTPANP